MPLVDGLIASTSLLCHKVRPDTQGHTGAPAHRRPMLLYSARFCQASLPPQAIGRPSSCRSRWCEAAERGQRAWEKQMLVLAAWEQGQMLVLVGVKREQQSVWGRCCFAAPGFSQALL